MRTFFNELRRRAAWAGDRLALVSPTMVLRYSELLDRVRGYGQPSYGSAAIIDIGGIETSGLFAHGARIGSLAVESNATVDGKLDVSGGLNIGAGGLTSEGGLGVYGTSALTGLVAIGTSTPYSPLEVWGPDTASTSAFAVANSASTTEFSVFDNGNATLAGTLTQNSDQRLKINIQSLDASSSLAAIDKLSPVTFNWVDDMFGSGDQLGFIAQQVQPIFPQLVATTSATALTPGGTLGLNYTGLISPIVAAIQALSTEIASLAQSITTQVLTAAEGHFTNELCVGSTCVTPAQFQAMVAAVNASQSSGQGSGNTSIETTATPSSDQSNATDTPPQIQINGNNPATVQIGATYNDLGATITGPTADLNLGIHTFVNGTEMSPVQIDTTAAATDTVDYVAIDQHGLTSTSTRTVVVEAPSIAPSLPAPVIVANLASSTAASSTTEDAATSTAATSSSSKDNGSPALTLTSEATSTDATSTGQ